MKQNIKNLSVQHLNSSHNCKNKNDLLGLKVTKMKRASNRDALFDQKHLTLKSIRASFANMFKPTVSLYSRTLIYLKLYFLIFKLIFIFLILEKNRSQSNN